MTDPTVNQRDVDKVGELLSCALSDNTVTSYAQKARRFINFCKERKLTPVTASQSTVLLYMRQLHDTPTIAAENYQPYMSAVNALHLDIGCDPPVRGHLVDRARKGSLYLQNNDSIEPKRYWIPADGVSKVLDMALELLGKSSTCTPEELALLRSCVFLSLQFAWFCRSDTGACASCKDVNLEAGITLTAVSQKGRKSQRFKPVYRIPADAVPGLHAALLGWQALKQRWKLAQPSTSFWAMPGEATDPKKYGNKEGTAWARLALNAVGAAPPTDFKYDGHCSRSGAATGANSIGVTLQKICFMADWSIRSSAVHDYIDLSAPPTLGASRFFQWLVPQPLSHGTWS